MFIIVFKDINISIIIIKYKLYINIISCDYIYTLYYIIDMFIIDFNNLIIKKIDKNNFRLIRICNTNSNRVYDRHNYNINFRQNM